MRDVQLAPFFREHQFEALVAVSPVNVFFLTGANVLRLSPRLVPERLALVLWPADGTPCIITMLQPSLVRGQSRVTDIRRYLEFRESPMKLLADVIHEKRLDKSRIAIEKGYLAAQYFEQLREFVPDAQLIGCDRELDRVRAIKTPEEIGHLRRIAVLTDHAIAGAYLDARVGSEERQVAGRMRDLMSASGADEVPLLWLAAGDHSPEVHHKACSRPLQEGDIVRVDIGGVFDGYYSDLARTAVVGKPSREQEDAYQLVWHVMEEVIGVIRPGVPARRLFEIYRDRFKERGYQVALPHVGHSLGIKLHEHPLLMELEEDILQENMVLEVELIHVVDGALYHNEDQVIVRASGPEIVSRTRDWSELLRIQ